jgi:hypothetical protein
MILLGSSMQVRSQFTTKSISLNPLQSQEQISTHRSGLTEGESKAEAAHQRQRADDPACHYVDDLDGYYDTDDECEEHNTNDDLMNMIEGGWD